MKVGRLLLRAAVGGFFIGHGTQKLFGWFGGQGLRGGAENFEAMGFKPGVPYVGAAGAAEALGGAGLMLGYRTPLASAGIVSVMLTAINRVHLKRGPWNHQGGYEYNVVLAAAAVALAESGPGGLSLDALRGKERSGALWGLFSLGLGAAGAAGTHFLAEARAGKAEMAAATAPASNNGSDPMASSVPVNEPVDHVVVDDDHSADGGDDAAVEESHSESESADA